MNYKETGFRAFYHQFCVLPITKHTKKALTGFPGVRKANGILTYGYYDRDAGLTLEVLATAQVEGEHASFEKTAMNIHSFLRIEDVAEDDFLYFADEDGRLAARYAKKIETLHPYDADEAIEKTREMTFLDGCRHEIFIDDIKVFLVKEGLEPEVCWVRMSGLGEHFFLGILRNEPAQDFGCHKGEEVVFHLQQTEDQKLICICDRNSGITITRADLEDGSMLEAALHRFQEARDEPTFINLLELLRDSYVWIPCNAVLSDEDQERMNAMFDSLNGDFSKLKDMEFVTQGETRFIPDLLLNGEALFFPIFSTEAAMGEYGNGFSKVQKPMLEAIAVARNNEKEPVGIVLNAFSEPFVLNKELWELVESIPSRIQEV